MQYPQNFTGEQWLAYKRAVSQPDRTWAIEMTIDTDGGEHLALTDGDIVADSLVMKEQSTCSDGIMVGSTYANSLEFSLINGDGRFREYNFMKAKVSAAAKLYIPETEEWAEVKLGTFIVLEAGKKYSTIPIKCIDRMCLFNRPLSDAEPAFPVQLRNLFMSVCLMTGISYTGVCLDFTAFYNIYIKVFDAAYM